MRRRRYWGSPSATTWVDYDADELFPAIVVTKDVDIATFFDVHHAIMFVEMFRACTTFKLSPTIIIGQLTGGLILKEIAERERKEKGVVCHRE